VPEPPPSLPAAAEALGAIDEWPAPAPAAAVVRVDGVVAVRGPAGVARRWASITKLVTAIAVLVAAEEGILDLDEPAGPAGSTVRHLLAHASGLPFESGPPLAPPGERRIYSNPGYEELGRLLERRAEMPFDAYLGDAVLDPLGLTSTRLAGTAAAGLVGPLTDLATFAKALFAPPVLAPETFREATTLAFPGLPGVLPGVGRYDRCDWGLGFELRDRKSPHWTGRRNSPDTFGHFGGSGSFLWLDPEARVALVCLADLEFGDWALATWPALSDAVLAAVSLGEPA
jgi:CubicO group peptidase (beta-lactamase class C family)